MEKLTLAQAGIDEPVVEVNKKELFERLNTLMEQIRSLQSKRVVTFLKKEKTTESLNGLVEQCVDLQVQLLDQAEGDLKGFLEIKREVVSIKSETARYRNSRSFVESVSLGYTVVVALMILALLCDFHTYITNLFGINTPERYITFGFAGAILYLITSILTGVEKGSMTQFPKVLEIFFRLILAMVVPIVLVALIFGAEGLGETVNLGPELLSFACGYSSKLVVDIFNKVVEKATKILDAI